MSEQERKCDSQTVSISFSLVALHSLWIVYPSKREREPEREYPNEMWQNWETFSNGKLENGQACARSIYVVVGKTETSEQS